MSYAFVSSASSNSATLASFVISAGQSVIVIAYDQGAGGSTLTVSDGTNTYVSRGTVSNASAGITQTLLDCLSPTPGTYTLTVSGASGPGITAMRYTGLASFSAGSFVSHDYSNNSPTTTDGVTTTAIAPTSFPAMIFGSVFGSTARTNITTGTSFTQRVSRNSGGNQGEVIEDLRLTSGSHAATFTASTVTFWDVLGAAYIEAAFPFGTVIQSNSFNDTSITVTHSLAFTGAVNAGSCLFLALNAAGQSVSSISDSINGTWKAFDVGADGVGPFTTIFSFPGSLAGATCTVTITLNGAGPAAFWIGEVSGIQATNALDATGALATGTSATSMSVSTSKPMAYGPEFVLCTAGYPSLATPTALHGLTLDPNGNVGKLAVSYIVLNNITTPIGGFSVTPAVQDNSCLIATYTAPLPIPYAPIQAGGMIQSMAQ